MRVIAIGFYYVIGPLACTSMTNYQNPQAFNVWKATIIGAWAQNLTQIFLLSLFVGLLESISSATSTMPVAAVALYFGAFSLIMTAPSFVQAMIGGYASGIMDVLNQFRGGFGMAKSLVTGAVGSMIGRSNPHTGHLEGGLRGKVLGDVNGQGNRVGGARGAIFGNPDSNGNRTGGIKGAALGNSMNMGGVTGRQGGIRGAIFGNDQLASGVGGAIERTRAGGMANIGGKKKTDSFNSAGQKTGSMQKRRLSVFRGSDTTAYNPETGAQMGDPVHQRGPVPMFLSDLGNRFSGGGSDQSGGGSGSDTSAPNYTSFNSGGSGSSGGGSGSGGSGSSFGGGSTGGAHSFQMHSSASTRNNLGGAQSSGPKSTVRSSGTNGNTTSHTQKTGGSNGPHTFKMKSSGEIRSSLGNRENNSGGKK